MSFTFAEPRHLWLEISPTTQKAAWQSSQQLQAPGARWQVYLNQLCVNACLHWFQTDISPTATAWPAPDANPVSWELVTGSCIQFDHVKLVLIPTDTVGQEVLEVPQEWVDIPGWAADYYLAVKVNPDEGWVEIWGYATQRQLKIDGEYDTWERLYSLDSADLISDISALWTTIERYPTADTQAESPTESALQSELSTSQAENLIARLANSDVAFPRLSMPFVQWGALLANETWWQQLCTQRLVALPGENTDVVNLSHGLQRLQDFAAMGWRSIEAVFGAEPARLAFSLRGQTTQQGFSQAKEIQLGQSIVRLAIHCYREEDDWLAIQAQLYPAVEETHLPENVTFTLVSEENRRLQIVRTRIQDNFVQLKRFTCPDDYQFSLVISLDNDEHTELFET